MMLIRNAVSMRIMDQKSTLQPLILIKESNAVNTGNSTESHLFLVMVTMNMETTSFIVLMTISPHG